MTNKDRLPNFKRHVPFEYWSLRFVISPQRKERESNPQGLRSTAFEAAAIAHWLALPFVVYSLRGFRRGTKKAQCRSTPGFWVSSINHVRVSTTSPLHALRAGLRGLAGLHLLGLRLAGLHLAGLHLAGLHLAGLRLLGRL
jgi:hypothetical protein